MTRFPKLMDVHFNSADINGIKNDPDFARGMNSAGYGMGKDQLGLIHDRDTVAFTETPPGRCAWTNPGLRPRGISTGMTRQMPPKGSPSQPTKTPKVAWGVWFPNRINAGKATVTIGGTATPIEKRYTADQRLPAAPGTGTQKGRKSRRGNEISMEEKQVAGIFPLPSAAEYPAAALFHRQAASKHGYSR